MMKNEGKQKGEKTSIKNIQQVTRRSEWPGSPRGAVGTPGWRFTCYLSLIKLAFFIFNF